MAVVRSVLLQVVVGGATPCAIFINLYIPSPIFIARALSQCCTQAGVLRGVPMKRKGIWTVVGLVVVAVAVTAARADFRRGHGWCRNGWHQGGRRCAT